MNQATALLEIIFPNWKFAGPVLVAPSVIQDPQTLAIKGIHNDTTVQDGHTRYVNIT